jgi:hypothetical protein
VSIAVLDIIASNDTVHLGAEAVATHVLLSVHMLFLNILLLNLLIAVFAYVYQQRWSQLLKAVEIYI